MRGDRIFIGDKIKEVKIDAVSGKVLSEPELDALPENRRLLPLSGPARQDRPRERYCASWVPIE